VLGLQMCTTMPSPLYIYRFSLFFAMVVTLLHAFFHTRMPTPCLHSLSLLKGPFSPHFFLLCFIFLLQ
jgi:hypothetical protein